MNKTLLITLLALNINLSWALFESPAPLTLAEATNEQAELRKVLGFDLQAHVDKTSVVLSLRPKPDAMGDDLVAHLLQKSKRWHLAKTEIEIKQEESQTYELTGSPTGDGLIPSVRLEAALENADMPWSTFTRARVKLYFSRRLKQPQPWQQALIMEDPRNAAVLQVKKEPQKYPESYASSLNHRISIEFITSKFKETAVVTIDAIPVENFTSQDFEISGLEDWAKTIKHPHDLAELKKEKNLLCDYGSQAYHFNQRLRYAIGQAERAVLNDLGVSFYHGYPCAHEQLKEVLPKKYATAYERTFLRDVIDSDFLVPKYRHWYLSDIDYWVDYFRTNFNDKLTNIYVRSKDLSYAQLDDLIDEYISSIKSEEESIFNDLDAMLKDHCIMFTLTPIMRAKLLVPVVDHRQEHEAATLIQNNYRKFLLRKAEKLKKMKTTAATNIQKIYRGFQAKKAFKQKRLDAQNQEIARKRTQEEAEKLAKINNLFHEMSQTPNIPQCLNEICANTKNMGAFSQDTSALLLFDAHAQYFFKNMLDDCDIASGRCREANLNQLLSAHLQSIKGTVKNLSVNKKAFFLAPNKEVRSFLLLPVMPGDKYPRYWPALGQYKNGMKISLVGNQLLLSFASHDAFMAAIEDDYIEVPCGENWKLTQALANIFKRSPAIKLAGEHLQGLDTELVQHVEAWKKEKYVSYKNNMLLECGEFQHSDDKLNQMAIEHVERQAPMQTAKILSDMIKSKFKYSKQAIAGQTPETALRDGAFQCDMAAVIMIGILQSHGINARYLATTQAFFNPGQTMSIYASKSMGHALVEVLEEHEYGVSSQIFDPTPVAYLE